jgi:alkanesulfonate monooxygenase SsuD/methylene tetrahydromethanopterin reductase-like flavin-dependent oxidoreductase (luciferase family)
MQALIHPIVGLSYLYTMGGDLSAYPVDGPVPPPNNPSLRSFARVLFDKAHEDGETIRQLYERVAAGFGTRVMVGTPETIADDMELWFTTGAADGFNFNVMHHPGGLEDLATLLLPELRRRGLFRTEYEGHTLRANLGLRTPVSRYATQSP